MATGRTDRYGRVLATIRIGGPDVGDIQITQGLARRWPDGHDYLVMRPDYSRADDGILCNLIARDVRPRDFPILSTRRHENQCSPAARRSRADVRGTSLRGGAKGALLFTTMHSFNGLERQVVIAINLDDVHTSTGHAPPVRGACSCPHADVRRLRYSGIRERRWVQRASPHRFTGSARRLTSWLSHAPTSCTPTVNEHGRRQLVFWPPAWSKRPMSGYRRMGRRPVFRASFQ